MIKRIACVLSLLAIASCSHLKFPVLYNETGDTITENTIEKDKSITSRLYEVKTKDTLVSLARNYNTTPQALIALNDLEKPYTIKPGQLIKVPMLSAADETAPPAEQQVVRISPKK